MLILTTACSSAKPVDLTIADNGSQVDINVGMEINIMLDGNPSTGYTWVAKDLDTAIFEQIGNPVFTSNNPGQVGSRGTIALTFKALRVGTTILTLVYQRPWEFGVDPLDIYSVTVNAK
jgi:predicted secreted protein